MAEASRGRSPTKGKKDFSIPACSSSFACQSTVVERGTRCQCGHQGTGLVERALTPDFNGIPLASSEGNVRFRNTCGFAACL